MQIWHAFADRSGNGSYLKKLTPYPRVVEVGILGGTKIKNPGNVMNCSENQKKLTHPTPGGSGSKFQKSGKFHELPRKSIKKC